MGEMKEEEEKPDSGFGSPPLAEHSTLAHERGFFSKPEQRVQITNTNNYQEIATLSSFA